MHATPQSRFRTPWLIVTLAAIGVIALAVGVVHFAPMSCAAMAMPPAGPVRGIAVFYNPAQAEDRCSIEPLPRDGRYASLPAGQYAGGAVCGAYLDITGPHGFVEAEIVDSCPGCGADQLDLSSAAFARIQAASRGTAAISYQVARDPQLPGPLAVRVGAGSTAGSLAVQILNHGNPLAGVRVNGQPLALRPDGYWVAPGGAGGGPFQVTVTDNAGHRAVLTGITLRPGAVQQTSVLMYGPATMPPSPVPSPGPVVQRASVPPAAPAPNATRTASCQA